MSDQNQIKPSTSDSNKGEEVVKERIAKTDMFMMMALWLEMHPSAKNITTEQSVKSVKCGLVLVNPQGFVLALDFTSEDVHPAVRCMVRYGEKVKGCDVYMSRRPCSMCMKAMVQAGISKIYHWPLPAEKNDDDDDKIIVNYHAQVRPIGISVRVPKISDGLRKEMEVYFKEKRKKRFIGVPKEMEIDWSKERWTDYQFDESSVIVEEVKNQLRKAFIVAKQWLYWVTEGSISDLEDIPRDGFPQWLTYPIILHSMRLADLLSFRTDDPKTGVGAVILAEDGRRYLGVGWNGYPRTAEYADYPRIQKGKYPYVIHAEYNALFFRNEQNLKNAFIFTTREPCGECAPMLWTMDIRRFIYLHEKSSGGLQYGYLDRKKDEKEECIICEVKVKHSPTDHVTDTG